jgi:uroporphyrinogen-III synthase
MPSNISENSKFTPSVFLLKNKTVPRDPYLEIFQSEQSPVTPEFLPLLQHEYIDPPALKKVLESPDFIEKSGPIIITSQRAIEAVNTHLNDLHPAALKSLLNKSVYTVGPATYKVLSDAGFTDIRGGQDAGNGAVLAEIILKDLSSRPAQEDDAQPQRLIFFTGQTRRDIIPRRLAEAGVDLTEQVVYRTLPLDDIETRVKQRVIESVKARQGAPEDLHYLVFFSPAETDSLVEALNEMGEERKCYIVAIGPTTKEFLEKNNLPVDVMAEKPDAFHLLKGIVAHQASLKNN